MTVKLNTPLQICLYKCIFVLTVCCSYLEKKSKIPVRHVQLPLFPLLVSISQVIAFGMLEIMTCFRFSHRVQVVVLQLTCDSLK